MDPGAADCCQAIPAAPDPPIPNTRQETAIMAFKRTGSQDELRASMTEEQLAQHETVYQASRGGHYPAEEKPVPGTPKQED